MTIALVPVMREPSRRALDLYAAAQLLSMTSWAWAVRRCPDLPREERLAYFLGFSLTCWSVSLVATAAGYYLSDSLPPLVRLGLVFLNPVYFVVVLLGDTRNRLFALALAFGGATGPLFHLVDPQWSVLLAGVIGGSAAYAVHRGMSRRHA